jgi:hypothetical protein
MVPLKHYALENNLNQEYIYFWLKQGNKKGGRETLEGIWHREFGKESCIYILRVVELIHKSLLTIYYADFYRERERERERDSK